MKASCTGILIVAAVVVVVVDYAGLTYFHRPQPLFKEAVAFVRSVHAFVEARTQRESPLPPSVHLRELVGGGGIAPNMARRFDGSEITFPRTSSDPVSLEAPTAGLD